MSSWFAVEEELLGLSSLPLFEWIKKRVQPKLRQRVGRSHQMRWQKHFSLDNHTPINRAKHGPLQQAQWIELGKVVTLFPKYDKWKAFPSPVKSKRKEASPGSGKVEVSFHSSSNELLISHIEEINLPVRSCPVINQWENGFESVIYTLAPTEGTMTLVASLKPAIEAVLLVVTLPIEETRRRRITRVVKVALSSAINQSNLSFFSAEKGQLDPSFFIVRLPFFLVTSTHSRLLKFGHFRRCGYRV